MGIENGGSEVASVETGAVEPQGAATPPQAPASEAEVARSIEDKLAAIWDKRNPERDSDGTFKSRVPPNPNAVEPQKQAVEPSEAPAPQPAIGAPNSWTAEMKAAWDRLPAEVRPYIAQREAEAHKAITTMGQTLKQYEPIGQTIARYHPIIQQTGMAPEQAIERLFTAQAKLMQDPIGGIEEIARSFGVNLRDVYGAQPDPNDPSTAPLVRKLSQVEERLAQQQQYIESLEAARTQHAQQSEQALMAQAATEIETFKAANPLIEEPGIRPLMAQFVEQGLSLQDAYDRAIWADPATRAKVQAQQKPAVPPPAQRAEAMRKAEVRGDPRAVTARPAAKPMSDDSYWDEAYERARQKVAS